MISWKDLGNYLSNSKTNVEIFITPPKKWFEESQKYISEIDMYDNYLLKLSENQKVTKTCNLYHNLKLNYSKSDYVDNVHLSKKGHKKWAEYIFKC